MLNRFCTVRFPLAAWKVSVVPKVAFVGVPEIRFPLSDKPPGSAPPTRDQTQLAQPGANSAWLYGTATIPTGSSPLVVIANGSTPRVKEKTKDVAGLPRSVSVICGKYVPAAVVVPRICPDALMLN